MNQDSLRRLLRSSYCPVLALLACIVAPCDAALAEESPSATFLRAINLNGPPLLIDGQQWEGKDSPHYRCQDRAFENQSVPLTPPTDAARATMIRSSRWGGNRLELIDLPPGRFSLFLYLWEDNRSETFSISVNGQVVAKKVVSGNTGHWQRMGPWFAESKNGRIVITSKGGAANFSGIEIWRGQQTSSSLGGFSQEQLDFFENQIRPLLAAKCYGCHSAEAREREGDLLVDSRPGMLAGGSRGPAVVPGKPDQSTLFHAITYADDELQMPPEGKLSRAEIESVRKWIGMGAPDPRDEPQPFVEKTIDLAAAQRHWSFQPVQRPVPPNVQSDWPNNAIDEFILAKLIQDGLTPAPDADKLTWLRRATYDLTGLPPTQQEMADFLADKRTDAKSRVIDRLLSSPAYGERWGRFWMDLVRYADTAGDNSDYPIPQAYLYRNYIIDAFNDDVPYDRFIMEQLAGDQLPYVTETQRNNQIIATGYIAISRRFGSVIKDYPQHLTIADTIDNVGRTFLGLTLTCARCHDHKFDPITQPDYYGLYGIFASTQYPFPGIELDKKPRDFVPLWENGKPSKQLAYAVTDGTPMDARIHIGGEPKQLGDTVPRKFLDVLGGQLLSGNARQNSGRRELAEWIASPDNPLTARVMVNRVWQHHFGIGLVDTPSDFGMRGRPPTHPALLDYLADQFIRDGWSLKSLHRRIMLSRTYGMTSLRAPTARIQDIDPANRLYWRFRRRRLDAEQLRDTLMLVAGSLDRNMPRTPHPFPPSDKWQYTQHHPFRDAYPTNHRSVYLMTARLNARPYFTTFDGPDRNAGTARRDSAVTTVQSLYLLNAEFIHEQSTAIARRLQSHPGSNREKVTWLYRSVLGRPPEPDEQKLCQDFLAALRHDSISSDNNASGQKLTSDQWASLVRAIVRSNEFLYVD